MVVRELGLVNTGITAIKGVRPTQDKTLRKASGGDADIYVRTKYRRIFSQAREVSFLFPYFIKDSAIEIEDSESGCARLVRPRCGGLRVSVRLTSLSPPVKTAAA